MLVTTIIPTSCMTGKVNLVSNYTSTVLNSTWLLFPIMSSEKYRAIMSGCLASLFSVAFLSD